MNKYEFIYYLNTATAERRPTTKEDIENDWREEEHEFNSDLEAFEYVYTDILDEYEADLDDLDEFYNDYEATTDNDKIEAFKSYFDSCDVGDGSTIIVQIKKDNEVIYDSGFSKEDLIDNEEFDAEEFDENLSLMEVTMKKLSENLEEDKEVVSNYKQKFIDFCSDKIEDLGDVMIDETPYHVIMHTEGIREFTDLRIIADLDNYEFENLVAINEDDKIVINTPMIDFNEYAATMQFDVIDEKFYNNLMNNWEDLNMNERISDELGDEEEFDESLSLIEATMKKLSEDFEEDELDMYNLVKSMIDKLNEISKEDGLYWEANEIYNNCAITEDETDQYMEIFVYKDKEGNIKYSTDEEHADSYDTVEDAYEACMWKSAD